VKKILKAIPISIFFFQCLAKIEKLAFYSANHKIVCFGCRNIDETFAVTWIITAL
jgi:hypothetical protein